MAQDIRFMGSEVLAPYRKPFRSDVQIRADDIAGELTPSRAMFEKAGVYAGDAAAFHRLLTAADPVPPGITGMRLDLPNVLVEILAGDEVVEIVKPTTPAEYCDRLEAIEATLSKSNARKFRKDAGRIGKEIARAVVTDTTAADAMIKNQTRADQLFDFNREAGGKLVLQKPTTSKSQIVLECIASGDIAGNDQDVALFRKLFAADPPVSFLVEHDWRAAFAKSEDFDDGDVKLPFEFCIFEFRVSDHHICIFLTEGGVVGWFVEVAAGWICGDVSGVVLNWQAQNDELNNLLTEQVRAVCIALDAEVAEKETVRAPEKLQRARMKRGKKPLRDYHVVKLSRKERAAPLETAGDPTGRHTRLHFVRGHWRHFEKHKTWIRWHLRGDPDLGFIDKHYRF